MIFDFTWFIITLIVLGLILLIKYKTNKSQASFWDGLKSFSTWIIALVLSVVLRLVLLVGLLFFRVETELENFYADLEGKNVMKVIVKSPSLFLSAPKPIYIGAQTTSTGITVGDTLLIKASFNKGKGFTGLTYYRFEKNSISYWIAENSLMGFFDFTYAEQPLTFMVSGTDEVKKTWENAQWYMSLYKKHHGSDITKELTNDTIMYAGLSTYNFDSYLEIKKIKKIEGFQFTVSASQYRGVEKCMVKSIESRLGNRPRNDKACAYYMMHGFFYKDLEIK